MVQEEFKNDMERMELKEAEGGMKTKVYTLEALKAGIAIMYVIKRVAGIKKKKVVRNFEDEKKAIEFFESYKERHPAAKVYIDREVKQRRNNLKT